MEAIQRVSNQLQQLSQQARAAAAPGPRVQHYARWPLQAAAGCALWQPAERRRHSARPPPLACLQVQALSTQVSLLMNEASAPAGPGLQGRACWQRLCRRHSCSAALRKQSPVACAGGASLARPPAPGCRAAWTCGCLLPDVSGLLTAALLLLLSHLQVQGLEANFDL